MGIFKKKQCEHKLRDFDWYLSIYETNDFGGQKDYTIRVIEPYVCILCGKRDDITLATYHVLGYESDRNRKIAEIKAELGEKIKPRAIVEDAVYDAINVDKEYVKQWLAFRDQYKNNSTRQEDTQLTRPVYSINDVKYNPMLEMENIQNAVKSLETDAISTSSLEDRSETINFPTIPILELPR